jgi:hypothetical protein
MISLKFYLFICGKQLKMYKEEHFTLVEIYCTEKFLALNISAHQILGHVNNFFLKDAKNKINRNISTTFLGKEPK